MRMPRLLIAAQSDGVIGSWQRDPVSVFVQVEELVSSTTPSVTMNKTPCGLSPLMLVPLPGLGMVVVLFMLLLLSVVSKFVSTSPTPPAAPHGLPFEEAQTLL